MAKKISKKYPDNYTNWIRSIYVESITLNKILEFNELMMFIRALDEEQYEFNINVLCNHIDLAYSEENYKFLAMIKMYNDPTLINHLNRNLIEI